MKKRGKSNLKKEKAVMVASSVLVLAALTITGVYVRSGKQEEQDGGYTIDFSSLEEGNASGIVAEDIPVTDSDLDYDPASAEPGSSTAKNTYGSTANDSDAKTEAIRLKEASSELILGESGTKDGLDEDMPETPQENTEVLSEQAADLTDGEAGAEEASSEAVAAQIQPELTFSEADSLIMPLSGSVLIDYSADKSVYFPTLQQYKCSPALVIGAAAGESVKAAADGMVSSIYEDPITGTSVVMNLGNGYELTYGQLQDVTVSEGAYVAEGEVFAEIAQPTRYYAVEGSNLYLKLTKDGVPVNPNAEG